MPRRAVKTLTAEEETPVSESHLLDEAVKLGAEVIEPEEVNNVLVAYKSYDPSFGIFTGFGVDQSKPAPDPSRKLQGKDYIDVAPRLNWLRQQHPDWEIVTDLVTLDIDKGLAVFKCSIYAPIRTMAGTIERICVGSGYGSETKQNFAGGWLEKAETVALGRACITAGYGILQAQEIELEDDREAQNKQNKTSHYVGDSTGATPAKKSSYPDTSVGDLLPDQVGIKKPASLTDERWLQLTEGFQAYDEQQNIVILWNKVRDRYRVTRGQGLTDKEIKAKFRKDFGNSTADDPRDALREYLLLATARPIKDIVN